MFQCFFEIGCDKSLFDGLRIAEESTLCETYMGKFPVISISLKGIDDAETGIVIEVKYAQNGDLEAECQKALTQMRAMHYEEGMRDAGMRKVFKYGIACWKKNCKVVVESESLV